jgi:mannitol-1-phosphate/altronate dehydrogenase
VCSSDLLNDLVARVIRDPSRKLAYDDRFYGTMRVCLSQGVRPINLARGAAAALKTILKPHEAQSREDLRRFLLAAWNRQPDRETDDLVDLTWQTMGG